MLFTFVYCILWMLMVAGFSGIVFYYIQAASIVCDEFDNNSLIGWPWQLLPLCWQRYDQWSKSSPLKNNLHKDILYIEYWYVAPPMRIGVWLMACVLEYYHYTLSIILMTSLIYLQYLWHHWYYVYLTSGVMYCHLLTIVDFNYRGICGGDGLKELCNEVR